MPITKSFVGASMLGFGGGFLMGEFHPIQTITVGAGGASSIEFTGIPGTYQHLQVRFVIKSNNSTVSSVRLRFNSDSGNNYATHYLYGDGASAAAGAATNSSNLYAGTCTGNYANVFGASVCDILDYANTSKNTTTRALSGADVNGAGGYYQLFSGLWVNTAAVTSITLNNANNTLQEHSTAALFGVKAP